MSTDTPTNEGASGPSDPERFRLPAGDDLQRLREAAGLTVEEVAAAVGVSLSAVRGWEDGQDPRVGNLRELLSVLRDPPENIDVGGGEPDFPDADALPDPIPLGFLEHWGVDDVERGLSLAENAPTSTPPEELKRCAACLSRRWVPRPGGPQKHRVEAAYGCDNCSETFDTPAPPEAEVDHAIDTVLRLTDTDTCCACGDTAQLFVYDSETSVGGYVCWDHLADLLARGESE